MSTRYLVALLTLVGSACGSDDNNSNPDTTTTPDTSEVVDDPCVPIELDHLEPLVFDMQDDVHTSYSYKLKPNLAVPLPDFLVLQFYNYNERIDAGAGTFSLAEAPNDNFGTCPECIGLWLDQPNPNSPAGKILFQRAGTIILDLDPRTRRLNGRIEGLRFQEIAIDELTLSSTFVEGGMCARMTETLTFDFKWIPDEWTCDDAGYFDGATCDCDCGAIDPDCYPIDAPPNVPSDDCTGGETCYLGECVAPCSNADPVVACQVGEVCRPEFPSDVCVPRGQLVNQAQLGQTCGGSSQFLCAPSGSNVNGACAYEGDNQPTICRPLCETRADCEPDQFCWSLVVGPDGAIKGNCANGVPPNWFMCDAADYNDGTTCHCGCGDEDPDCDDAGAPIEGCAGAEVCDNGVCQAP